MSKKVLVLGGMSDDREVVTLLQENAKTVVQAGEKAAIDLNCDWTTFDALEYIATNDQVAIYNTRNNRLLATYDLILFRAKIQIYNRYAQVVCNYLDMSGIPYSNHAQGKGLPYGKLAQMFAFHEIGVPIPSTYYAAAARMVTHGDSVLKFPMIVKDNTGAMGRNNHLVDNKTKLKEILNLDDHSYIAQSYIPNDCDYRVFVVGQQYLIIRRRGGEDTHLNNISKGGSAELVDVDFFPERIYTYCRAIMERFALEIAGIDLIYNPDTQEAWFLEVNQLPKIVHGAFYAEKTALLGNWLKTIL